ncbi:hypothetical protein MFIFM68171_07340 [Madurella fahalii]|uniref:Uncharacterized protein n=1 Tax=Madurella fahalii TaxID=1157608 RepID=A0ABQ0GHV2_9PEZI
MQLKYLALCLVSAAAALPVAENPMPAPPVDIAPFDNHVTRRDNAMPAPPDTNMPVAPFDQHAPRDNTIRDNHMPSPPVDGDDITVLDSHMPRRRENHAPVAPPDNNMPVAPFDQHAPRDNAIRDNNMPSPPVGNGDD